MTFSYFKLNTILFTDRFLLQKHRVYSCLAIQSIYLEASDNKLPSLEDPSLLTTLESLESFSGQKPSILTSDFRYVGTTKKGFFSSMVRLDAESLYYFLEVFSICFLPPFQKRNGVISDNSFFFKKKLTLCCHDTQLFAEFEGDAARHNLLVTFLPTLVGPIFLDLLQTYKFNFLR